MNNKMGTRIRERISIRYNDESSSCSNLSCGGNLTSLNLSKGEAVLDLGCGRGHEAMEAADIVGESGKVYGIDLSPEMIKTAQENAEKEGLENIEFINDSIEKLPFENDSLDAVISNCVINHVDDKTSIYKEIYRVLRAGGRFVVSDAVTKEKLPVEISEDPEMVADCFGGAIPMGDYLKSIENAGFNDIEIIKKREYKKRDFDFISITIKGYKAFKGGDKMKKITGSSKKGASCCSDFKTAQCCSKAAKVVAGCHD